MLFRCSLLCVLFALLAFAPAQGQNIFAINYDETPQTFFGGFVGGLNASQVDGDTYSGYHKAGWNAGAVVYARFSDNFGMSGEILYTEKGSKTRQIAEDFSGRPAYELKMKYVEMPLMVYVVPDFIGSNYHFRFGISYAKLISATERATVPNMANFNPADYPFRKQDIDYIADISYMLYKGLFINARYAYSIVPFREAQHVIPAYGYGERGQYHNYFSLRLMYLIK